MVESVLRARPRHARGVEVDSVAISKPGQLLTELYDWYVWAEPMLRNIYRDASVVPFSAAANSQRHFEALHLVLMEGRRRGGRRGVRIAAAIGHALDFGTWRSLTRDRGLKAGEVVNLMIALVDAAGRR